MGGVEKFKQFMDSLLKKDDLTSTYECYVQFEQFKRSGKQTVDEFLIEFDKLYNRADKRGVKLPDVVKAFKLLDASDIDSTGKMMIFTAVDYGQKDRLYDDEVCAAEIPGWTDIWKWVIVSSSQIGTCFSGRERGSSVCCWLREEE